MADIQSKLKFVHNDLIRKKFPYHSVSVICRKQDLGYHVIFMESVRYMVDENVLWMLKNNEFTHSFVDDCASEKTQNSPKKHRLMALTEGDFYKAIDSLDYKSKMNVVSELFALHTSECERIAELAFNAARKMIDDGASDNPFYARETQKYPAYQDYKNSQQ